LFKQERKEEGLRNVPALQVAVEGAASAVELKARRGMNTMLWFV
jgi:hypothetical protein